MDTQKTAEALTKALGYAENGGKPNIHSPKEGKTGEMASIFQFTPATWKNYSHEVFGKDVPMTPDNESHVVLKKVTGWLDKGYKPEEVASMWNAGVGEPEAYGGKFSDGSPSIGVNHKYGVKYDVPAYAKKVVGYFNQFSNQPSQGGDQMATAGGEVDNSAPLKKLMGIISETQKTQGNSRRIASSATPTGTNKGLLAQALSKNV